jgi:D-threo-aldose 1-dehydrogenase
MGEETSGWMRTLGSTGLSVSAVTAGGAPLGGMPEIFGEDIGEESAVELVKAVLDSPIRVLDTSNGYSDGRSETRTGLGIAQYGGLPSDFLVATKVDPSGSDYSGDRVRESVRQSKQRLGLDSLPLVYLHDPEFHDFDMITAPGGAVETLTRLVEEGEIGHIGVAGGDVRELSRYLDLGVFEVLLTHNRWTIVDRSAGGLIASAVDRGVAVVNAAIYGGGILAHPETASAASSYGYRPVRPSVLEAIRAMNELAEEYGTDLPTVALRHSVRDSRIDSTVVGFSRPERIESIVRSANVSLPEEFWAQLERLVPPADDWLDS